VGAIRSKGGRGGRKKKTLIKGKSVVFWNYNVVNVVLYEYVFLPFSTPNTKEPNGAFVLFGSPHRWGGTRLGVAPRQIKNKPQLSPHAQLCHPIGCPCFPFSFSSMCTVLVFVSKGSSSRGSRLKDDLRATFTFDDLCSTCASLLRTCPSLPDVARVLSVSKNLN